MPQKHSRVQDGKRLVWYTENLWAQAAGLHPFEVEVESFKEMDEDCWFGQRKPTLRAVAQHCQRINAASFDWPIILHPDGTLMDGGHRLCKALLEGRQTIAAVQFAATPEPDECYELNR